MARTNPTRLVSSIPRTRADLDCAPVEFRSLGEYMQIVAHASTIDDQRSAQRTPGYSDADHERDQWHRGRVRSKA